MDENVSRKIQLWAAWTGPLMVVFYSYCFFYLGHNWPLPPIPKLSGEELVASYYVKYRSDILLGMSMAASGGMIYMVWTALLAAIMWKREKVPVLALMQFTGGIFTAWLVGMCPALWAWCARYAGTPGVDAELVKAVHIFGWYIYDMTWLVTGIQLIAIGVFTLADKTRPSLFPRWLAYACFVVPACWSTLTFIPYFEDGPLAHSGWWNFHVAFILWGAWYLASTFYMYKNIKKARLSPGLGLAQANSVSTAL